MEPRTDLPQSDGVAALVSPNQAGTASGRQSSIRSQAASAAALLVALLALACVPATGSAAPQGPWILPAIDIATTEWSGGGLTASGPQIAVGPGRTATAVWTGPEYGAADSKKVIQAATRPPGGSFAVPVNLSLPGQDAGGPRIAIGPDDATTVVWIRSNTIQAATRAQGGSFGAAVNISPGSGQPQIAIAPDATATVVWSGDVWGRDGLTQAATRPPGGSFETPVALPETRQGPVYGAQIASSPDGTATVVWSVASGIEGDPTACIQATTRPPGGSFKAPVDLSGSTSFSPQIVTDHNGTATAVWRSFLLNDAPSTIQTASTGPPVFFALGVTKSGTSQGKVTSSPAGIECGADCNNIFDFDTKVTLTATPDPDSSFTGWFGHCSGMATSCEVTMTWPREVTAKFDSSPPPPDCKKATLSLVKVKKDKNNGTAKVTAKVGEAGKVILKGLKKVKKDSKEADAKGAVKLKVKAKAKAAKKLKKKGEHQVKAKVLFKPASDCPNKTRSKEVKLVRRG